MYSFVLSYLSDVGHDAEAIGQNRHVAALYASIPAQDRGTRESGDLCVSVSVNATHCRHSFSLVWVVERVDGAVGEGILPYL